MSEKKIRYPALDLFRGITVILMIIVNRMDGLQAYPSLLHAPWNGCTLADLVFPFFLFIVGSSYAIALSQAQARGADKSSLYLPIVKRAAWLFALGLLLNILPNQIFDPLHWRYLGVLQRIAICYFLGAVIFLQFRLPGQLLIAISLLLGYAWMLQAMPFPGKLAFDSPSANWAFYFDRQFIPLTHMLRGGFDPEGLFSTVSAIVTTLLGAMLAELLISSWSMRTINSLFFMIGLGLCSIAWLWQYSYPFNKALWSSSYVLWTGGLAYLGFLFCTLWMRFLPNSPGLAWVLDCGRSALGLFLLHVLILKCAYRYPIWPAGLRWQQWLWFLSPENQSLLQGLCFLVFCYCLLKLLQFIGQRLRQQVGIFASS